MTIAIWIIAVCMILLVVLAAICVWLTLTHWVDFDVVGECCNWLYRETKGMNTENKVDEEKSEEESVEEEPITNGEKFKEVFGARRVFLSEVKNEIDHTHFCYAVSKYWWAEPYQGPQRVFPEGYTILPLEEDHANG